LYEGFGLPPLEAMACGTPVITSNTASLPEVAGDAAILVDPLSPEAIGRAMQTLLEDPAAREQLSIRGIERARLYSWDRCAAEHAVLYRRFSGF
jgi:glycosyltransferase involved in cell wall biosynthesis